MDSNKTILTTTYAVHPLKGSEDGMGWNYVLQIARFNKVVSVTRKNNRDAIEKFMSENPNPLYENITFLYFDLPKWQRFWKKGKRGALLYYYFWQRAIPRFIKKQDVNFDIAHNLNFHNDWTPSFLWKLKTPFVWGPIGHHPKIPTQYLKAYSWKYGIKDKLTWMVKQYFWKYSISLRETIIRSDFIWAMNSEVPVQLPMSTEKHFVKPSVASQDFGYNEEINFDSFTIISAGRFVPLKGFDLTILSFAKFLDQLSEAEKSVCHLTLVGNGPERNVLEDLISSHKIGKYVTIIDWVERKKLMEMMKNSSAFLFPSHEGAGMVVPEALSFGLPIICLDNCGPGEFITPQSGFKIEVQDYDATILDLSNALKKLYHSPELNQKMSKAARSLFEARFHWDRRGEWLKDIYANLGECS